MKRFHTVLLSVLLLSTQCTDVKNPPTNSYFKYGGYLKLTLIDPVQTLDPAEIIYGSDWKICTILYEGLIKYGAGLNQLEPCIAESWEKLDGGKRWIFKIRKNAKFHDDPCFENGIGRNVNPEDIVYSFERISKPDSRCLNWSLFAGKIEGINDFHEGRSKHISGISILDSSRIEFSLTKPFVTFLKIIATPTAAVVPREAVEYYGEDFDLHPVGTGPFRLAQWKQMKEIILVKNENYWGVDKSGNALPFLDGIYVTIIPNFSVVISEFLKGENHIIQLTQDQLNDLKGDSNFEKKITVHKSIEATSIRFLGFSLNTTSPFSNSSAFRKACAHAFNRLNVMNKIGLRFSLANSLVPPIFYGGNEPTWYDYNLEKALRFIEPIIQKHKKDTVIISSTLSTEGLTEFVSCVDELGINSKMIVNPVRYYRNIVENRPDVFRVSMVPAYPDPEEYFSLFYSKSDPAVNLTQFKNEEFDKIFEQSMTEQNDSIRTSLFISLENILKENVPAIYLTHEKPSLLVHPNYVKGVQVIFGPLDYSSIWIDKESEN